MSKCFSLLNSMPVFLVIKVDREFSGAGGEFCSRTFVFCDALSMRSMLSVKARIALLQNEMAIRCG